MPVLKHQTKRQKKKPVAYVIGLVSPPNALIYSDLLQAAIAATHIKSNVLANSPALGVARRDVKTSVNMLCVTAS